MKILFRRQSIHTLPIEEDFEKINLRKSLNDLRDQLEIAYCGFDYATEPEMIDSYIYEIKALQEKYNLLSKEAETASSLPMDDSLYHKSPVRALVNQVFG